MSANDAIIDTAVLFCLKMSLLLVEQEMQDQGLFSDIYTKNSQTLKEKKILLGPIQQVFENMFSFPHIQGLIQVAGIRFISNDTQMYFEKPSY